MTNIPELRHATGQHFPCQFHFAIDIEKLILHLHELAARCTIDLANEQIVLRQYAPVTEKHLAFFTRHAQHVCRRERTKFPNLLKIVYHDLTNVLAEYATALPGKWNNSDGNRIIDTLGDLNTQLRPRGN